MPDKYGIKTIDEWKKRLEPLQIRNAIYALGTCQIEGNSLEIEDVLELWYGDRNKVLRKYGLDEKNSGKRCQPECNTS